MARSALHDTGAGTGSLKGYVTGFILSIALTAIAFALVMKGGALPHGAVVAGIFGAAVLQILTHLHYFLHMDTSSSARWNVMAMIFTLLIMFLFVGGSIWIMFDLNYRMM